MTDVPELRSPDGTVLLRAHRPDDAPAVVEQGRDPDMQRFTTVPVPYADSDAAAFLDHVAAMWTTGTGAAWAIEVEQRFAGTVDLRIGEGWASIGYGLAAWARGRGVMTTAVGLALRWGFTEGELVGVRWEAYVGNEPSRRVAEKCGVPGGGHRPRPVRGPRGAARRLDRQPAGDRVAGGAASIIGRWLPDAPGPAATRRRSTAGGGGGLSRAGRGRRPSWRRRSTG